MVSISIPVCLPAWVLKPTPTPPPRDGIARCYPLPIHPHRREFLTTWSDSSLKGLSSEKKGGYSDTSIDSSRVGLRSRSFCFAYFFIFVSLFKEIVFLLLSKKFEDNLKAVCKCFQSAFKFTGSRIAA